MRVSTSVFGFWVSGSKVSSLLQELFDHIDGRDEWQSNCGLMTTHWPVVKSQGVEARPRSPSHQQNTDSSPPWSPECLHAVTECAFSWKLIEKVNKTIENLQHYGDWRRIKKHKNLKIRIITFQIREMQTLVFHKHSFALFKKNGIF